MLTQQKLKELLSYDPNTGDFIWLQPTNKRIKVGDKAGYEDTNGYICIKLLGTKYRAHRLAWIYIYGDWPINQIDHINRVKQDNRILNLRDVTHRENHQNRSNETVGVKPYNDRWIARIKVEGKDIYLGIFNTKPEAISARKEAEIKYEFYG